MKDLILVVVLRRENCVSLQRKGKKGFSVFQGECLLLFIGKKKKNNKSEKLKMGYVMLWHVPVIIVKL